MLSILRKYIMKVYDEGNFNLYDQLLYKSKKLLNEFIGKYGNDVVKKLEVFVNELEEKDGFD